MLDNPRLLFPESRVPLAAEAPHQHLCNKPVLDEDLHSVCGIEDIAELLAQIQCPLVIVVLPANDEGHRLEPLVIGIVKQHLDTEARRQTSLVANVIPIRRLFEALIHPEDISDAIGEEHRLSVGIV